MSSPNPYNPQGHYPQQGQYSQGQYNPQAQAASRYEDDLDAIPMKKSNPMLVLAIAGGAVLVLGVAAFSFFGGKKTTPAPAAQTAQAQVDEAAKAKAMREHLEITQRSLAKLNEANAAKSAQAEPQAAAQPAPAEPAPERTAHTASGTAQRSAPAAAPAPAPKPVNRVASKKKLDSLDDLGKGISSALGK